jgi:pyruvate formate lyase activating enzyme
VEGCPADALEIKGRRMTVDEIMSEVKKDAEYYRQSGGGLTLSGGEPMTQFQFAHDIAAAARALGIHTVLETSGLSTPYRYRLMLPVIDLFLFDYKATDPVRHEQLTGVSNELILSNLDMLYESGARIAVRCPLVPGINDDDAHLSGIADLSRRYPNLAEIEIMPYHRMGNEKGRRAGLEVKLDIPNTDAATKAGWEARLSELGCQVTVN